MVLFALLPAAGVAAESTPEWIHQFGTSGDDRAYGISVDKNGNVFVAGHVDGELSGQDHLGGWDAFIRKYSSDGNEAWTRQFGSSAGDVARGVAIDANGNSFVVGDTDTALPGQTNLGSDDAFIRKYDSAGTELWTSQFGSSGGDYIFAVAVDNISGNVFVTGHTNGALPEQIHKGYDDAFVRKYDSAGNVLWTSQFGTTGWDNAFGIAIYASNVFVVGYTNGMLQAPAVGSADAFIRKYDSDGNVLWTRQFGSSSLDQAYSVTTDTNGNAFVAGFTSGTIPGQTNLGSDDAFIRKYDSTGIELWTRQFGSSAADLVKGIASGTNGSIFVVGYTSGNLFGQAASGSDDAFIRKYDSDGNVLWTSQFGASAQDRALGVAIDESGNPYVAGYTNPALPGQDISGANDAFVSRTVDNNIPVADNDTAATNEDTLLNIAAPGVLDGDTDIYGNILNTILMSDVSNGTLDLNADGSFTYLPESNFSGTDSFTYKAYHGISYSMAATVTITITAVNDVPVATDVTTSTVEDTAKAITLTATDADSDSLTYSIVADPTNGSLGTVSGSSVTYTPNDDYVGSDSFTYKTNDGNVDSNIATVTITVTAAATNNPPVATAVTASTVEDTAKAITLTATDADSDSLTYSIVADPTNGSLGTVSGSSVTYTPNDDYVGSDSFTYKANDGTVDSNIATVTITITAVNNAPLATDVTASTVEDTAKAITLTATDADLDSLTYSIVADPTNGSLGTVSGSSVTYTPNDDYVGSDSFTYKTNDGNVDSNIATVTITVTAAATNNPPVATAVTASTVENTAKAITLTATDADSDPLTYSIVAGPTNGSLGTVSGSSVTYTPYDDYVGSDSFTYKANDGTVDSNIATVTITVTATIQPPSGGYNPPPGGGGGPGDLTLPVSLIGFTSEDPLEMNMLGQATQPYEIHTKDGLCTFSIATATYLVDRYGGPVEQLTCIPLPVVTHPAPEGYSVVLAYDFGPDGTNFRPYPIITIKFDPATMPGVDATQLKIAMWGNNAWEFLESTVKNNTVFAEVRHFTNFALLSPAYEPITTPPAPTTIAVTTTTIPIPTTTTLPITTTEPVVTTTAPPITTTAAVYASATFTVSNLTVSPSQVKPGEKVTVSAVIANTGETEGTFKVTLKVNGLVAETKLLSLTSGESSTVTFTTSDERTGNYEVNVEGLSGSFKVAGIAWLQPLIIALIIFGVLIIIFIPTILSIRIAVKKW